uniref:CCHC-type domain-containing protein n=4 Tax=Caenorhabditis japonica TaxID=281687 RepID=A0A8R1IMM4_CAEJA
MDSATLKMFLAQQQEAHKEQLLFLQQQQEMLLETILKKIGSQSDHTNTINSLNGRISTFSYNSEDGETFDRWYGRYEDVIKVDGAQLDDASKARFLVTKLDKHEAEQFRNHILPKMPAEVNFDETVAMLRKLFNETKSITRLRYELLSVKFDGYDRKIYTGLVKSRFSVAQWSTMTEDQAQCLLWIMGLQSHEHADLRARALRELEHDSRITLTELTDRLDQVIALRNDADFMGGPSSTINAVNINRAKQQHHSSRKPLQAHPKNNNSFQSPNTPCYKCGQMHWARDCKLSSNTVCRNCSKTGHLAKVCKSKRSVNNAIFISQSSARNRNRIYHDVEIEGKKIRMQLDTGAEVTLMNLKDWMRLNKPKLSQSKINLHSANNELINVKGQFKCNFTLNGHHGSGLCHVTETESLLGLDWIAQDTTLYQHLIKASVNKISKVVPEAPPDTYKRTPQKMRKEGTTQEALQKFVMSYRSTPLQHLPQHSPHCQSLPKSSPARRLLSNVVRQSKQMDSLSSVDLPSQQMDSSSSDGLSLDGSTMDCAGPCAPVVSSSSQGLAGHQPLRRSERAPKIPSRLNMAPSGKSYK